MEPGRMTGRPPVDAGDAAGIEPVEPGPTGRVAPVSPCRCRAAGASARALPWGVPEGMRKSRPRPVLAALPFLPLFPCLLLAISRFHGCRSSTEGAAPLRNILRVAPLYDTRSACARCLRLTFPYGPQPRQCRRKFSATRSRNLRDIQKFSQNMTLFVRKKPRAGRWAARGFRPSPAERVRAGSIGGGAENRTPVHTKSSTRLYKLSWRSGFGADRFANQRGRS